MTTGPSIATRGVAAPSRGRGPHRRSSGRSGSRVLGCSQRTGRRVARRGTRAGDHPAHVEDGVALDGEHDKQRHAVDGREPARRPPPRDRAGRRDGGHPSTRSWPATTRTAICGSGWAAVLAAPVRCERRRPRRDTAVEGHGGRVVLHRAAGMVPPRKRDEAAARGMDDPGRVAAGGVGERSAPGQPESRTQGRSRSLPRSPIRSGSAATPLLDGVVEGAPVGDTTPGSAGSAAFGAAGAARSSTQGCG